MVFVQFYNNPSCNVGSPSFNYHTWQTWAASSLNPSVKVYVGVPGSTAAAGSGFISSSALEAVLSQVLGQPNFGGVMMWDAIQAFGNVQGGVHYAQAAKNALVALNGGSQQNHQAGTTTIAAKAATTSVGISAPVLSSTMQAVLVVPTTLQTVTKLGTSSLAGNAAAYRPL